MFLRLRRRMLANITFSALFLITFFILAGHDLAPSFHEQLVDKTRAQWDFDRETGGIKPEDGALKKGPKGKDEPGTYRTTNELGFEVIATSRQEVNGLVEHTTTNGYGYEVVETSTKYGIVGQVEYTTTNAHGFEVLATTIKQEVVGQLTIQTIAAVATATQAPFLPAGGASVGFLAPSAPSSVIGEEPQRNGTDAWYLPEHWVKQAEKYPVAPEKLIKLPTGTPGQMAAIQATFTPETKLQKQTRKNRQAKVKEEFQHAWRGYKDKAWTHDELRPVTGGVKDPFCGWAATIVDALDTLWIMGLKQDFEAAVEEVGRIDFTSTPRDQIPVFETTIRYLGGMLAAYDVSGGDYPVLLVKAKELAEILMGAFDTPNRMPVLYYSWKPLFAMQAKRAGPHANFAELSSLTMEFTRLAQLTGEDKYYDAVARITDELVEWQKRGTKLKGVFPFTVDAQGCNKSGTAAMGYNGSAASSHGAKTGFFEEPESNPYKAAKEPVGGGPSNPMNVVKRDGGLSEHATPTLRNPSEEWNCTPQGLTGELRGKESFSMGGGQDSGYEYFLKMHLLLGGLEPKYKALYRGTVEAIKNFMLYRPMIPDESRSILFTNKISTYGHPEQPGDMDITYEVTHLTCFVGGMIGMGAQIFEELEELSIAERLTDGCVYAYSATKSGIMPELARAVPCSDVADCKWDESLWHRYLDPMTPEDRQRDVDTWERKTAEKKNADEEAAEKKSVEEKKSKKEVDAILDYDRKKLDASYAAYAYRLKPGTQANMSTEVMAEIDKKAFPSATINRDVRGAFSVPTDAEAPEKSEEAITTKTSSAIADALATPDAASDTAAKPSTDLTLTSGANKESPPKPADNDVVANPNSHASAPGDAVVVEPATKAGGHGSRKREVQDSDASAPQEPKPEDAALSPPTADTNAGSTIKTGAQTAGDAMLPVEGDSMVGGAPPPLPILNQDRISADMPRPKTHKEYVEERLANNALPRGFAGMDSTAYILRPEAIESVWYMHRITADPKWADKGWDMFQAIIRNTKTEFGHSAIHDVNALPTVKVDAMESFWLAETLKYFYLLYSEPDLISLDEWVLNTEAHPFRRPTLTSLGFDESRIKKLEEYEKKKKLADAEAAKKKAQHEEYLKRLEEIERAKAAGAGRGGVAAKLANLPDTPLESDEELRRKQEAYWKLLHELKNKDAPAAPADDGATTQAQKDEYFKKLGEMEAPKPAPEPEMTLEEYATKFKADAWAAKVAKLRKLEADMAAGSISAEEASKIAKELKEDTSVAPEAGPGPKLPLAKAAIPAPPVVVKPAPIVAAPPVIPAAPAPAVNAVPQTEEEKAKLEEYMRMLATIGGGDADLQAYAAQAKADAYAAKLAKLQTLEAGLADGSIDPAEAAKMAKELKTM